jgi:hypothetical protein
MHVRTISYEDFNDVKQEKEYYFNLSHADIAEWELTTKGGLAAHLQNLVKTEDPQELIANFKMIISKSIGQRSDDGSRFEKSDEITKAFMQSNAYSALFMTLITNPDEASKFINGVVPADLAEMAKKAETDGSTHSEDELLAMPQDEFDKTFGKDPKKWSPAIMSAAYHRKAVA